jgi:branched-chain amino acid transport system permease protein
MPRSREGLVRAAPSLLLLVLATVLLVSGVFILVELVQRFLSQDYRTLASAAAAAGREPPTVAFLGRDWSPRHAMTWILAPALLACGACAALLTRRAFASRAGALGEDPGAAAGPDRVPGSA